MSEHRCVQENGSACPNISISATTISGYRCAGAGYAVLVRGKDGWLRRCVACPHDRAKIPTPTPEPVSATPVAEREGKCEGCEAARAAMIHAFDERDRADARTRDAWKDAGAVRILLEAIRDTIADMTKDVRFTQHVNWIEGQVVTYLKTGRVMIEGAHEPCAHPDFYGRVGGCAECPATGPFDCAPTTAAGLVEDEGEAR